MPVPNEKEVQDLLSAGDLDTYSTEELLSLVRQLQLQLLDSREYAIGQSAEAGEARARLEMANRRIKTLKKQNQELKTSATWKIGRLILFPIHIVRQVAKR